MKVTAETLKTRRDQLVLDHLPLVKAIARRVLGSLPVHTDLDDLIHAGALGLIHAATMYDSEKKVTFQTYAKHRIRGAMLDSLRQQDWASRDIRRRHKSLEAVTRDLVAKLGRQPEEHEIAEKMGVGLDRWRTMAAELQTVGLVSASSGSGASENPTIPDFPAKEEWRPDWVCEKTELSANLLVAIESLPERYQHVVLMYYTHEMTMKEIGATMKINESRVSQIHKTALEKMAHALRAEGIETIAALL